MLRFRVVFINELDQSLFGITDSKNIETLVEALSLYSSKQAIKAALGLLKEF